MSAGGCWGGRLVFYCDSLSVRASGVRADRGGADVGSHGSQCDERQARDLLLFTPDGALLLRP